MLQAMGLERIRHTLVTEQKQRLIILSIFSCILILNIVLCGGAGSGLVAKLCPTLLQPHVPSVHGISQARI